MLILKPCSKSKIMIRPIILLVFLSCSCSRNIAVKETPSPLPANSYSQDSLYIYLTGGFINDSLAIEYSGERIIETDVITDEALGYAKEVVLPYIGTDTVHVSLERPNRRYSTEIINQGGNFIEVWYCSDDELKHYQRSELFRFEK